ncbi:hypothetical protein [Ostreiculturibacter nitratireducens]|uniref:hypothetical protein n=1 Tax=Ostreiculturibacter nitratireducens TaxID=3075226 RepID=UPI0031B6023C
MSELAEYQRRIAAALDRIGKGLEARAAEVAEPAFEAGIDPEVAAELESLRAALASERDSNNQLIERIRAVRRKQERAIAGLQRQITDLKRDADAAAVELERHKRVAAELADTNRVLREAAEAGVSDPELLNASLKAEFDALRAARAAEIAELDAILSALGPVMDKAEAGEEANDA